MGYIDYQNPAMMTQTRMVQRQNVPFLTDIHDRTILGYKYFDCADVSGIALELRGTFAGTVKAATDEDGKKVFAEKVFWI